MVLSSFKTYVKQDFKRTDKDTELVQAYNDMIRWVAVHMPHGNYKFQSYIFTVASQEDYPLPTNIIHLMHPIRFHTGSTSAASSWDLVHLRKEEYDLVEPAPNASSPSTGQPREYTIYSRQVLVTPIPDVSTYLLEINWSKRPTALANDADVPLLGEEWDEVLKHGTLERLFAGIGLTEEAQYWASKYRDGDDNPVGNCRKLFQIENDMEGWSIGQVKNNAL